MAKLVTVYLPTRNRINLLERAINSVITQTYSNFELIIVNDGSVDSTGNLLAQKAKQDQRIKVIENCQSLGPSVARNKAILEAKGYFITGLDDDDYFGSTRIQELVDAWSDNFSFLTTNRIICNQKDLKNQKVETWGMGEIDYDRILISNAVGNQVFTKVEYLKNVEMFDPKLQAWVDYDLWIRLIHKYGPGIKINQPTYFLDKSQTDRITNDIERTQRASNALIKKYSNGNKTIEGNMRLTFHQSSGTRMSFLLLFESLLKGRGERALRIFIKNNILKGNVCI